ncbi:3-oxoacyl-[acyl-carrier protein] reductase [Anseongella ginsenosidimutans]|uniref:3-oxoacyl-[acyl-carrier protein] reductase n=1 Tax=Anseongella ginsenosidimutans TaxID=496056 RepID=A0A4R3KT63_9SPHI|nr:3-oxoacyl-ACP reductase family protein [Anseongella ginsenosidimutans]QEC53533.1 3-oxoacyl-ACP reductase FabG [Anseongella ginsenosidimutans]TCS88436.1 3-oxoacyl-[acyl-carrier protein] reductase [Anseongella ginsenosidimutans]
MKKLVQKTALVMGGSRGIGASIVKRLAAEGAAVAFTYSRSAEKAEAIASEINAAGGEALAVKADSSRPEEVTAAVSRAAEKFGRIDLLVNNAGVYNGKPFEEHSLEDYEDVMAVNVRAVYLASHASIRYMAEGGRIITIGSNMADQAGSPQATLYTMSKSALQGFTRGLARDLGAKRITVNLVQPGPVDTDMNPANTELADFLRSRMAIPEYGKGEDVAGLVAFLASNEGKFITGAALTIDGGLNA